MEYEPEIPQPRESETLLIVVDTYVTEPSTFLSLRDAAMRMARTRLLYSLLRDDLLAVIASGSSTTKNKLASENEGGYLGLCVLQSPVSKNLNAVRVLADLKQGMQPSNLLNALEVCGDTLSEPAVTRSKKKRVVLFTDALQISKSLCPDDVEDFQAICELYKAQEIQIDVICDCEQQLVEKLQEIEEVVEDADLLSIKDWMNKTKGFQLSHLFSLCKFSGGVFMSRKEASPLVDIPTPKVKRATAKYRGTLNIADVVKIPVMRYSYVYASTPVTPKKLSWEASTKCINPIPVFVETQRVASAKDDAPLKPEEIINAYPYGPELVPEQNEVDTYAWSIVLPKGLDILGFVEQNSVPQRLFMGRVDVVIAMPSVPGADELMKTLVLAMQAENVGILARSVTNKKGGAPSLVYLWPRVEAERETGALRSFFLFQVEIPMREDVRDMPFASLMETAEEIPEAADLAMSRFISAATLDVEAEHGDGDEDDREEPVWPSEICNPNLDWNNICIIHRALAGISGADFPSLTEWQQHLISPLSFIGDNRKEGLRSAILNLKSAIPVIPAQKKEKKGKRTHEVLNGDMASISDYLPREMVEGLDEREADDEGGDGQNAATMLADASDDVLSLTGLELEDVGDETPVLDFENLVTMNKFNFAAVSLLVVVRRLIRDVVDDDRAMNCLQALRKASVERKEPRFFNDFIISLIARCKREDTTGNRTRAFFRHVHRCHTINSTVQVISIAKRSEGGSESAADEAYREFLSNATKRIHEIVSKEPHDVSVSAVTNS